MGSGATKPQPYEKLVYETRPDGAAFTSNEDDTVLLLQNTPTPWQNNCIFTKDPLRLSTGIQLRLTVKGAGILRFGFATEDPRHSSNLIKSTILEHEDGFERSNNVRIISVDAFNFVTYADEGEAMKKDLTEIAENVTAWLYVMVLQGCPQISIKKDNLPLELKTLDASNITVKSKEAIPRKTSSSGVCRLEKPVSVDLSYNITWQMKLAVNDFDDNVTNRKYGFFRFGFVSAVPHSLNHLSLYSGQMDGQDTWFVESAVSSYLYSEIITFTLNQEAGTISHNLALASAKRFVTEKFPLDCTRSLYLVLEIFHGDVCGVQKYPPKQAPKPEFPGHILLFKNFRPARSVPEHIQIGVKFKTEPCRIQYGTDPTMVLAEFRKRFQDKSLKQLLGRQSLPWDSHTEIGESSKVQVLDVPDYVTAEDLETFFSNKSACGGGKIKRVKNVDYIPGCWVIEYADKSDARAVWQERNHRLITSMVTILPYYDQLGPTHNYGLKPEFDRSDLEIVIENEKKMSYISTVAKKRFEQYIETLNLMIIWPTVNQPAFDDCGLLGDTTDGRTHIVLECKIPVNQYQQLVSWKETGRKAVARFLTEIQICEIVVAKAVWEEALSLLNREKKANDFVFEVNKSQRIIDIISSNQSRLFDLKNMIKILKAPEEQVSEKLDVDVFKYKSLDNAGLLTELESSSPKTSSTLDTKNHLLVLKGPKAEVRNLKTGILNLLVNTELIAVKQTEERISILKCSEGRKALQQKLRERKLTEDFEIRDSVCEICVYCGPKYTVKQAEKTLSECLNSIIKEEKYNVPDDLLETLHSGKDLATVIRDFELLNNNTFVISVDGKVITCTGISSMVKLVIADIKQYLQGNKLDKSIIYFQRNIVNYIETFNKNYGFHNCTFLKNESGMLTGEILIKDKAEKVTQTKQAIQTATEQISTFWFYLQRPWLSNAIMSLDTLHSLALKQKSLLQPEIGETLAQAGVPVIAVSIDGTAVQIINCNITDQDTDVIVNAANETLHMTEGLSKAISDAAGSKVQDECTKYIETNGRLFEGRAMFTNAGNLKCREILHVVGPVWKDGKDNERNILQSAIISALNMVNKKRYLSVMIPAISCGDFGYPNDLAADHIVEAVDMFVSKNPDSTVKEIYLCDMKREMVTLFEKAMHKVLRKPWFIFEHKLPLKTALPNTDVNTPDESPRLRFDKTSRPGQRNDILGISMRWGRNTAAPNRGIPGMLASPGRSDHQTDRGVKRKQQRPKFQLSDILEESGTEFNALPMSIDLTSRTKLTVVKGTIENQQVDIIVCTSPQFPDIVGAVANAILRKGGDSIKSECKKRVKLQYGDVICTGKGTLPCKKLFHVRTLTDWSTSTGPKNVRQIVGPCLREADKKGCVSIAFPVIGIGACHYPADQVAEIMTETISEYIETNTGTTIQEIRIVIYERDSVTAQTFEAVIPKLLVPSGPFAVTSNASPVTMRKQDSTEGVVKKNPNFSNTRRVKTLRVQYTEPITAESHSEADDVVLIQVTTAGTTLKEIKQQAEELLEIDFLTNTIDFKTLTDERTLNEEEVERLMQLNTTEVKIDIDQKATTVTISGLRAAVKKADNEACNLLKTEFPQGRKQKKIESLIADLVQWQVSDGKTASEKVSAEVNFDLEMNYDKGVNFKYQNKGVEYQVLIQSLEEHPVNKPQMKRKLYRCIRYGKDTDIRLPDIWSISGTAEDYNEYEIPATDPLFNKIKKKFRDAGCKPMAVNKIIRIENRTLYLQYELMKKKIQIRNPTGIQNERELWHGSDKATIALICQKGFDRSFAGRNATHYGEGVYFANDSGYSHNFAAAYGTTLKRMILAKVLTGEYTLGKTYMKAPPNKTTEVLYDSLVDNVNNPAIFVIFHDTQAYPQYVIEYT